MVISHTHCCHGNKQIQPTSCQSQYANLPVMISDNIDISLVIPVVPLNASSRAREVQLKNTWLVP